MIQSAQSPKIQVMDSPIEQELKRELRFHGIQTAFIQTPFEVFEALYGGAAGGGKSYVLLLLPLVYDFVRNKNFKGILLRRTFPELEAEIIGRSRDIFPSTGAVYHEGKKRWTWGSGAAYNFGHCEKEQDVRKYDGVEYNYVGWDEATSFTEFQYRYLSFSRCRSSDSSLPAIVRGATNPGNIGHSFFRKRFVEPCRSGHKILKFQKEGTLGLYVPCLGKDNPYLIKNDPTYLARLQGLPEAERLAKLDGDWWTFEGQVFSEFRTEPFKDEPSYAKHVVDPFLIPVWWPRVLSIDWGWSANTCAIWTAISPDGRAYIYRTYCEKGKYIPEWSGDIIKLSQGEDLKDIVICHSAGQNRGEPENIHTQVQNAFDAADFGTAVRLGKKDRVGGKNLIHEYLRWRQKPRLDHSIIGAFDESLANSIFRNYGEAKYKEYLQAFEEPKEETNLPKLQILETSPEGRPNKELIETIPICVYDENNPEDVKEFSGDDVYDSLRDNLGSVEYYKGMGDSAQFDRNQQIAALQKEYIDNGNATSFHRKMEHLVAKSKKETFSVVKRYKSRRRMH